MADVVRLHKETTSSALSRPEQHLTGREFIDKPATRDPRGRFGDPLPTVGQELRR